MAVLRDRPYCQFNFLVDLGDGNTDGPRAGFQEVSAISTEVAVSEYRNGNSKENSPIKITGLNKATDVTLKRGVIGSLDLYQWIIATRTGDQTVRRNQTAANGRSRRTVRPEKRTVFTIDRRQVLRIGDVNDRLIDIIG